MGTSQIPKKVFEAVVSCEPGLSKQRKCRFFQNYIASWRTLELLLQSYINGIHGYPRLLRNKKGIVNYFRYYHSKSNLGRAKKNVGMCKEQ